MEINCTNCIYLSEDLASGTGETFCSCPEVDWYPEKFDSSINYASDCDFFNQVQTKKVRCGNCGGDGYNLIPRYDAAFHSLDVGVWKKVHCQACEGTGYIIIPINQ